MARFERHRSLRCEIKCHFSLNSFSTSATGPLRTKHLGYRITRRRENSQPLERSVASTPLVDNYGAPESDAARGDKRPFNDASTLCGHSTPSKADKGVHARFAEL